MLGNAQLSHYDNEPNNNDSAKTLEEAEHSFRTSLELEGKPSGGNDIPSCIQEQRWWKDLQTQNTSKAVPSKSKAPAASNARKANQRLSPTKNATTAARGRGKVAEVSLHYFFRKYTEKY